MIDESALEDNHVVRDHLMKSETYDVLKYIAQIVLPALGTFYYALAAIWGLPKGEEVVGTIMAADAFLGALLLLATKSYNNSDAQYDGAMNVIQAEDGGKVFSLDLNSDPADLESQDKVVFKVNSDPANQ